MSKIAAFLLLLCSNLVHGQSASQDLYPLDNPRQEAQFNHLLRDLRCLVCQNQDLSDSNADLAKDLKNQVWTMVQAGKTDSEITQYLTDRYGDFILFKPPVKTLTLLLWLGPGLFLLLGLLVFGKLFWKRTAHE